MISASYLDLMSPVSIFYTILLGLLFFFCCFVLFCQFAAELFFPNGYLQNKNIRNISPLPSLHYFGGSSYARLPPSYFMNFQEKHFSIERKITLNIDYIHRKHSETFLFKCKK